ncbi:hypothetical protein [Geomicrobium halophilum]|uniref:hypothetical protein n=1 Tax=Geomicrobium halophilum TaxID=549000 RepID=UPI003CCDDC0D
MRRSCLDGGWSFEGRVQAVRYKTEISKKVPLPINSLQIYAHSQHLVYVIRVFPGLLSSYL